VASDAAVYVELATLLTRLGLRYVEERSRQRVEAMTPEEILAACRSIEIRSADDLLAEGMGGPAEEEDGA
jgi:hypothetical protein